jgi:glycosyltransferase involved in cell wall biosynthesis
MNILMVGLDLNPPWVEGIRNTVGELSEHLLDRGHDVHFLTKGYNYHTETERVGRITYHRIITKESQGYFKGFQHFLLKLPKRILEIAKEYQMQVIHGHSSYPAFGTWMGLSSLLTISRKIFTLYSCEALVPPFEYSVILKYMLSFAKSRRWLQFNCLDDVVVISRRAFSNLIQTGFQKNKLNYIPTCVDKDRFNSNLDGEKIRGELKIPTEEKIILFAGDLTPYKGIETLLFSLKILTKGHPNLTCLVLTKGLYESVQHRRKLVKDLVCKLGLKEVIKFLGVRDDIEHVYTASDLVVLPFSRGYALMDTPRALLEAMACGKPVIATNVGGISEIIEDGVNGLIVKPSDEIQLVNAMKFLLQNEDVAEEIGRNASQYVSKHHDLNTVASRLEKIYQMV